MTTVSKTTTKSHRFDALSRRALLAGAAGLVIAVHVPVGKAKAQGAPPAMPIQPNVFVRVAPDSTVTVISRNLEMGQGPYTGFATLVAEEMDADWSQMRAEAAPANLALYVNPGFGMQGTGGSTSMTTSYDTMRRAGALARALLVEAAAQSWGVPAAEITVENGVIAHAASSKTGSFGEFAEAAATLTPPDSATLTLKDPSTFKFIGKDISTGAVRRVDTLAKSTGTAQYSIDIHEPNMLTAVIVRPPLFGAKATGFDDTDAKAIRGYVDAKTIPSGVAVYATSTWPAIKARRAMKTTWDDSAAEKRGTAELRAEFERLAQTPGLNAGKHGDVDAALADADQAIESIYEFPFLAHAPMEPLNGYIHWTGDAVHAKFSSQVPSLDRTNIAAILGVPEEAVTLEVTMAGGSFGRRGQFLNTFAEELAHAAKAIGPGRPLKVQWTREDDIQGAFYRPMMLHRFRGGVKGGQITAFADTVVGQSLVKGTPLEGMMTQGGIDVMGVEGVSEIPYQVPNFSCEAHVPDVGVQPLFWRSVGNSHTGFAKECFLDELLAAAGKDPVQGRLELLPADSREAKVLAAVAELANWTGPGPVDGRARGVAVVTSFGSTVAQIAEVSNEGGRFKVHKIWAAVDCGLAVNPDVVRAQVEGGVGYGLGHALYGAITLTNGVVDQKNFDGYRSIRIHEMPDVEVTILPSSNPPTGIGEPGLPPAGPAVANAMVALGMERPRRLPVFKA
jgi:isoquinoline 1-oxidoreductase beta subunit